ncbi:MAG: choice-of-anchor J domain-containing protein [bacterium]|nr:choice-of-anchor J domain-containing protein [bacterium]
MIKHLLAIGFISLLSWTEAQTLVYQEDFDNGIPAAYTLVDNDGLTPNQATAEFTDAWIALPDPLDTTDTIVGSTSYFEPVGTADRWLITPPITLGAYGNFLYWEGRSDDPSFPDGYFVFASKTDTQLSSFTDTVALVNAEFATWTSNSVNLSDYGLDGETIHLAFVNRTFDGYKLYLDSISVFVEDPVGLQEEQPLQVQFGPNPTSDQVFFNMEPDAVELFSLSGQTVATFEHCTQISLANVPAGMYWMEIREGNAVVREKIIKR